MESHLRIIILAAGSSERMGKPKQLLPYLGRSLILHAVQIANEIKNGPPVVVTGAYDELIRKELASCEADLVYNAEWKTGMASSIKSGLYAAGQDTELESVLITVSDQPYISAKLYSAIINKKMNSIKPIIACRYNDGTVGVPVLFNRTIFTELFKLNGQEGARNIIRNHPDLVEMVDFPLGGIDIDTHEDYMSLSTQAKPNSF